MSHTSGPGQMDLSGYIHLSNQDNPSQDIYSVIFDFVSLLECDNKGVPEREIWNCFRNLPDIPEGIRRQFKPYLKNKKVPSAFTEYITHLCYADVLSGSGHTVRRCTP
jgi:hypothetical protein